MDNKRLQILLVDDDPVDRMAIKRLVREGKLAGDLEIATSIRQALDKLNRSTFDLILADYKLDDGTGMDVLQKAGATPVIFITGSGDEEIAAMAVRMGAYDYLIKDPNSNYLSVLPSTIKSVLARRRAETALTESEERYRLLVELSPDAIVVHDFEKVVYLNPAARKLFGATSAEQVLGKAPMDLVADESRKVILERIKKMRDGETVAPIIEEKFLKLDGSVFHVETAGASITYEGKPAVMVVFRDTTERKKDELALREAKERAEQATLLKDKFVSLVAHDLRSPFVSIMGVLGLIQRGGPRDSEEGFGKLVDASIGNCQRALAMIDELLSATRLHSGKIQPGMKFIDAKKITLSAMANVALVADEKSVLLKNDVPEGTRLFADQDLIGEVIQNLLSNAIKFSKKGDTITIFVPQERKTTIAVKDTGTGVRQSMIPHLFKYDEKTSTPGTAGEPGTGLGLPLCADIMTAHGGSLEVESVDGKGSLFYAVLPETKPVIMVVDDSKTVALKLKQLLRATDSQIIFAGNGKEAIDKLKTPGIRPNLILLDLFMPHMDGFELLSKMKLDVSLKDIPVIVITGEKEMEYREKAFRLGADDFVVKPIALEELIPRVKKHII